jgi:hypothetical protein
MNWRKCSHHWKNSAQLYQVYAVCGGSVCTTILACTYDITDIWQKTTLAIIAFAGLVLAMWSTFMQGYATRAANDCKVLATAQQEVQSTYSGKNMVFYNIAEYSRCRSKSLLIQTRII